MNRNVVHAPVLVSVHRYRDPRELEQLEAPFERDGESLVDPVRLERREEADRAEVEPEDGHGAPRVRAKRGKDAAVAAEDHREVGGVARLRAEMDALLFLDRMLLDLGGRHEHLDSPPARVNEEALDAVVRLLAGTRA